MARQVRSEATRQKIIDAAIDVYNEVGYAAAGRGAIVERMGMTKGALYHHFDSMDALTSAIVDQGSDILQSALGNVTESSAPGLENMIHSTFVAAELLVSNRVIRASHQLVLVAGKFNESASRVYTNWAQAMAAQARRAAAEGDLRPEVDPDAVSESIIDAVYGAQVLGMATSSGDLVGRLSRMWELLLPAVATESSRSYFREFVAREGLRRIENTPAERS